MSQILPPFPDLLLLNITTYGIEHPSGQFGSASQHLVQMVDRVKRGEKKNAGDAGRGMKEKEKSLVDAVQASLGNSQNIVINTGLVPSPKHSTR